MPNEGFNKATENIDEYQTPPWLFKALDTEFGFHFDAAATKANSLCGKLYTSNIEYARIAPTWRVFCNPPYSNVNPFVGAALASNNLWVFLLPDKFDCDWYHRLWNSPRCKFRPLRKRIRFYLNSVEQGSPRFASMIVIVRGTL